MMLLFAAVAWLSSLALAFLLGYYLGGRGRRNGDGNGDNGAREEVRGRRVALLVLVAALLTGGALTAATGKSTEPRGVRLRPLQRAVEASGGVLEPQLIPWGETLDAFKARWPTYGPPLCVPSIDSGAPITVCREPPEWFVDFGDDKYAPDLALRFHGSRFYEFRVDASADRGYPLIYALMVESLGQPTSRRREPVQNAFGATFESNAATWELARVTVELVRRRSTIDDARLTVTYRPLEPSERSPQPRAPF